MGGRGRCMYDWKRKKDPDPKRKEGRMEKKKGSRGPGLGSGSGSGVWMENIHTTSQIDADYKTSQAVID